MIKVISKHEDGTRLTVPELFMNSYRKYPDKYCFTTFEPERKSLTYRETYENIRRISSYLIEMGIRKGDRVAIWAANSPNWGLCYLAIMYAGACVVPIDAQLKKDKVQQLASFADVRFLFSDKPLLESLDKDNSWVQSLLGAAVTKGKSDSFPSVGEIDVPVRHDMVSLTEDDMGAVLFTSGTTGNEKGAVLTQKNITANIFQPLEDYRYLYVDEKDVLYALLPLHHSYCCTTVLLETITNGAECVFGHGIVVSRMINDLTKGNVTIFMGIPLLYNKLLAGMMKKVKAKGAFTYGFVKTMMFINGFFKKHFGLNPFRKTFNRLLLSKLGLDHNRVCISGAGPLAPSVFRQYQQLGIDFVQGYGLTETSPILTLNPISHFKVDSVGHVLPEVDMIIADPDEDGVGEIRVKGPNICRGYLNDPENTKKLFDENGYLRTGDLGKLDKENYLYLKGRAKNLIVTEGGKNVYPEEIEDMFQLYDEVEQIMIRGFQLKKDVPSENIEAVIYPSRDAFKGKEDQIEKRMNEIVSEVNQKMSSYKKILKVTVLDKPMVMTSTKKVKRNLVEKN